MPATNPAVPRTIAVLPTAVRSLSAIFLVSRNERKKRRNGRKEGRRGKSCEAKKSRKDEGSVRGEEKRGLTKRRATERRRGREEKEGVVFQWREVAESASPEDDCRRKRAERRKERKWGKAGGKGRERKEKTAIEKSRDVVRRSEERTQKKKMSFCRKKEGEKILERGKTRRKPTKRKWGYEERSFLFF